MQPCRHLVQVWWLLLLILHMSGVEELCQVVRLANKVQVSRLDLSGDKWRWLGSLYTRSYLLHLSDFHLRCENSLPQSLGAGGIPDCNAGGASSCQNGGTCEEDGTCSCAPSWTMPQCTQQIDCNGGGVPDCMNGGTCVPDPLGGSEDTCVCAAGYTGNTCDTEIDECESSPCKNGAPCIDEVARFTCDCTTGFTGTLCEDRNECTMDMHNCDINAMCTNTDGSFTCTCNSGYEGPGVTCTDINECTMDMYNCDTNAVCTNTDGSFTCICNVGYQGTGVFCLDLGECATGEHDCDNDATCTNTDWSFVCTCNAGFEGDGLTCTDIDECASGEDNCDVNAVCTNLVGSFRCECNAGFEGNGVICTDIDECVMSIFICDPNAVCKNLPGFFACVCNAGFEQYGMTCTAEMAKCDSNPCQNGGTCTETSPGPGYLCSCASPFEGFQCEVDPPLSLIVGVTVQLVWMDEFTQRDCGNILSLNIICREVETTIGNDRNINIRFVGIAPTTTDQIALYLEIDVTTSRYLYVTTAFHTLVDSGDIQNIPVDRPATFLSVFDQEVLIYDVRPGSGPVAGGTPLTITGHFLNSISSVNLGNNKCFIDLRNPVVIICNSSKLGDINLVNQTLDISLQQTAPLPAFLTDFKFTYLPDPTISNVYPLVTVITGSVLLTVEGSYLLSPTVRRMETTVKRNTIKSVFTTPCYGMERTRMFCMTPDITEAVANGRRKKRKIFKTPLSDDRIRTRRQTSLSLNEELDFDVEIAFILDGVPEYRNLTAANLEEFSELTVYADPVVYQFDPTIQKFTSTWPVKNRILEIKGERLLEGLQEKDYTVQIGRAVCSNVKVQSNLIVCEPPLQRPDIAAQDYLGYNKIPVQVTFASQQSIVGYLEYIQTIWEYPPGRYGIIGGICGLILLIATVSLVIVWRHMKKNNSLAKSPGGNSDKKGMHLVSRVKRWSRRQAPRSSTFIPTGRARTDTYNDTMSDIRSVPFRTRPETFMEDEHFNLENFELYHTTFRNNRSSFI